MHCAFNLPVFLILCAHSFFYERAVCSLVKYHLKISIIIIIIIINCTFICIMLRLYELDIDELSTALSVAYLHSCSHIQRHLLVQRFYKKCATKIVQPKLQMQHCEMIMDKDNMK